MHKIDDVDDNASDGKFFKYKTKIVQKIPGRLEQPGNEDANWPPKPAIPTLNVEVTISLKDASDFLEISWFIIAKLWNRTLFSMHKRLCIDRRSYNNITGMNFMIASIKLYVPDVTFSINDNVRFLEYKARIWKNNFLGQI